MTPAERRAEKIAAGRVPCCVPHCGRTYKSTRAATLGEEPEEVMCGKHYRLASAIFRRRMVKVRKLQKRAILARDRRGWTRLAAVDVRLWQRIKKQAIERAVGI